MNALPWTADATTMKSGDDRYRTKSRDYDNSNPCSWGAYAAERKELADFFEDEGLGRKIIILSGDVHMLALDDGTNTQYSSRVPPGTKGPIVFQVRCQQHLISPRCSAFLTPRW